MARSFILIVAADDLARRLTIGDLEMYDHAVLTADSSDEAADLLKSGHRVGALVIDVDLPSTELDGLALAQMARKSDARARIVYTSRRPQGIPEDRKVPGAPVLRAPYFAHQLKSVLSELRTDIDNTPTRAKPWLKPALSLRAASFAD